jgi:hypothetical protein
MGASHRREPDVGGFATATVARTPSPRKHKPVIDAAHARVLATSSGLRPCLRPQLMAVRVRFTSRVDAARATGPDGCRSDASRARGTADARSACLQGGERDGRGRRGSVEDAHCTTERTFKREEPGLEHPFPPHYMTHAKPHPLHR